MTSKLTRERLAEIAQFGFSSAITPANDFEIKELARLALAAMNGEPVAEVCEDYAIRYISNGPAPKEGLRPGDKLYRHAQPAPGYPEVLPCSVLLEPGLRFGKGIKTSTMLAALARRAVYESDMAALSPEERAEFHARIEDFKALIAHPVPVVPQDVLEALQKVARIRLDMNDFDGDRRGIADCLCDAEEALIEVVNRRAAMLAAAPQSPGSEPATMPGKWIPVSERMPESNKFVLVSNGVWVGQGLYDDSEHLESDEHWQDEHREFINVLHHPVTHWMPLPAGPKEDVNALIPLVSRNEQEGK